MIRQQACLNFEHIIVANKSPNSRGHNVVSLVEGAQYMVSFKVVLVSRRLPIPAARSTSPHLHTILDKIYSQNCGHQMLGILALFGGWTKEAHTCSSAWSVVNHSIVSRPNADLT